MKYGFLFLAIFAVILPACDDADKKPAPQMNTVLPEATPAPVLVPNPDPVQNENTATSVKRKILDTRITPEMIKNLRFDTGSDGNGNESPMQPLLNSPEKTRILITPRFYLDESDRVKEDYLDYIDGAALQLEVKFD